MHSVPRQRQQPPQPKRVRSRQQACHHLHHGLLQDHCLPQQAINLPSVAALESHKQLSYDQGLRQLASAVSTEQHRNLQCRLVGCQFPEKDSILCTPESELQICLTTQASSSSLGSLLQFMQSSHAQAFWLHSENVAAGFDCFRAAYGYLAL